MIDNSTKIRNRVLHYFIELEKRRPGASAQTDEVADKFKISRQAASRAMSELQQQGYLRVVTSARRRSVQLHLARITPAGFLNAGPPISANTQTRTFAPPPSDGQHVGFDEGILPAPRSINVFVAHGNDHVIRNKVVTVLKSLGLKPIVLDRQASQGRTVIEQLELHANKVEFAVVLLSADDVGRRNSETRNKPRARQNTIFELGYFFAKLSRGKVVVLKPSKLEDPTDIGGIIYKPLDNDAEWPELLFLELDAYGFKVDIKNLPNNFDDTK